MRFLISNKKYMRNLTSIKERILYYLETKDINITQFYKESGVTYGVLSQKSKMSEDNTVRFLTHYSDVDATWLITGHGSMLKSDVNNLNIPTAHIEETRPRVPMDAAAGTLTIAENGVTISDCEQIPIISGFAKYDFTIMVRGDSMLPEFHSGDELACLFIKDSQFIQWGRVHVLDTSQGIVLKRIYKGDKCIICKSDNPNYPEFPIQDSELYNMALVIGMVRRY